MNGQVLVFGLLILTLTVDLRANDVVDPKKSSAIFSTTMAKINEVLESQHLSLITVDPAALVVRSSPNIYRKENQIEITAANGIEVDLLPGSLEVIGFQRDVPRDASVSYDAPPKPAWTPDQAAEKSKAWIKALLGSIPSTLGKPKMNYQPDVNLPKYYDGVWYIGWPRTDSQGHYFGQDGITVVLSEKHGLTGFSYGFYSKYSDAQKIVVSHDQAIEIGRSAAQQLLGSPLTADWSGRLKLLPAATAELVIVNPNHILKYKSFDEMSAANEGSLNARLAWVVEYRAENDKGMGRYVDVWVDTETKEILGGDFRG